jgi:ketosteroid isomerase-like protein
MRTITIVSFIGVLATSTVANPGPELVKSGDSKTVLIYAAAETTEIPMDWPSALRELMIGRRTASIQGDVDSITNSMADEYVQTDISGYRQDKSAWLDQYFKPLAVLIKSGKFKWTQYEHKDLQLQLYGDCAVVTGKLEAKGNGARFGPHHTWVPDATASFSGTLSFTHVYIRRDGKWLLAALHNAVPASPPSN